MSSKSSQNEEKEQTRGKRSSKERISALKSVFGMLLGAFGAKPSISEVWGGSQNWMKRTPNYLHTLGFGGVSSKIVGFT